MSSTASASPSPTSRTGAALNNENQSIKTFAASLSTAAVIFGVQIGLFLIFSGNWKLHRSKTEEGAPSEQQSLFNRI